MNALRSSPVSRRFPSAAVQLHLPSFLTLRHPSPTLPHLSFSLYPGPGIHRFRRCRQRCRNNSNRVRIATMSGDRFGTAPTNHRIERHARARMTFLNRERIDFSLTGISIDTAPCVPLSRLDLDAPGTRLIHETSQRRKTFARKLRADQLRALHSADRPIERRASK